MPTTYPQAGTKAEQILEHIQTNPGVTRNSIISGLSLNPSVVRRYVTILIERGLVEDKDEGDGFHHYYAKAEA